MSVLDVIIAPDSRLKLPCCPVDRVDGDTRQLMKNMLDSMHASRGIGLAAPQVGINKRVIVCDVARTNEPPRPISLANPEIVWSSDDGISMEEGCLSLPGHYADVSRPSNVKISYLDFDGKVQEIDAKGILAACLQHEIDHLDGILFVDHISLIRRKIIMRKLIKLKKQNGPS